jgi:hypothetical protein
MDKIESLEAKLAAHELLLTALLSELKVRNPAVAAHVGERLAVFGLNATSPASAEEMTKWATVLKL